MNFTLFTYKSQNCAPSQQNFAPSHETEPVTFRNSGYHMKDPDTRSLDDDTWIQMRMASGPLNTSSTHVMKASGVGNF